MAERPSFVPYSMRLAQELVKQFGVQPNVVLRASLEFEPSGPPAVLVVHLLVTDDVVRRAVAELVATDPEARP